MTQLVLHIGHGKTGSSHIQSTLALNINKLKKLGINYPSPTDLDKAKKGYINSGNGQLFIKELDKLNRKKILKKEITLYSDETLIKTLINKKNFNFFLDKNHKEIKVILYTRNFFEFEISNWGQLVKRHYCTKDLNTFLKNNHPSGTYKLVRDWIDLSKLYNFDLIIRNYSNYKNNIFNIFLEDVLGEKIKDNTFIKPKNNVNRSLSLTEYEIIRILNNFKFKDNLADKFVNLFPEIKAEKILFDIDAYNISKTKNIENISYINNLIEKKENIIIEDSNEVTIPYDTNEQSKFISDLEINLILDYLLSNFTKNLSKENNNLLSNKKIILLQGIAKKLIDISIKIENNKVGINDSIELMKIAKRFKPDSKIIGNKINLWNKKRK